MTDSSNRNIKEKGIIQGGESSLVYPLNKKLKSPGKRLVDSRIYKKLISYDLPKKDANKIDEELKLFYKTDFQLKKSEHKLNLCSKRKSIYMGCNKPEKYRLNSSPKRKSINQSCDKSKNYHPNSSLERKSIYQSCDKPKNYKLNSSPERKSINQSCYKPENYKLNSSPKRKIIDHSCDKPENYKLNSSPKRKSIYQSCDIPEKYQLNFNKHIVKNDERCDIVSSDTKIVTERKFLRAKRRSNETPLTTVPDSLQSNTSPDLVKEKCSPHLAYKKKHKDREKPFVSNTEHELEAPLKVSSINSLVKEDKKLKSPKVSIIFKAKIPKLKQPLSINKIAKYFDVSNVAKNQKSKEKFVVKENLKEKETIYPIDGITQRVRYQRHIKKSTELTKKSAIYSSNVKSDDKSLTKTEPSHNVSFTQFEKCDKDVSASYPQTPIDTNMPSSTSLHIELDEKETLMEVDEVFVDNNANIESTIDGCYYNSSVVYVVVDTNILIDDKELLLDGKGCMLCKQPIKIVIPYVVLQELDNLKNSCKKAKNNAQKAIKWCNSYLENEDPFIQGQSCDEYLQASSEFGGQSGDDSVLSCCLLYKKMEKTVLLLTNDINLRNKAIVSKIRAVSSSKFKTLLNVSSQDCIIFQDVETPTLNTTSTFNATTDHKSNKLSTNYENIPLKLKEIKSITEEGNKMKDVERLNSIHNSIINSLGSVLEYAMKDAFGDLWEQIVIYKPPWTATQILKCFVKHWIAVFIDKFNNDVQVSIKNLLSILDQRREAVLCDLDSLSQKLLVLFKLINNEPYRSIINQGQCKLLSYSNDQECSSLIPQKEINLTSDVENIKELIINVGRHASCVSEKITSALRKSRTSAQEDLRENTSIELFQSLESLRSTLVTFGCSLVSMKDNSTSSSFQLFSEQLIKYWNLAQETPPIFNLSEIDFKNFIFSDNGKKFLQLCLTDFEKIIQYIDSCVL